MRRDEQRSPTSHFEHDPLPDSTTHFRLLHIKRGDFKQHVECELSIWPVEDAPPYYAISYTWGDPNLTAEITVNGKPLTVRQNCEYVLQQQQAYETKASKYYWVDAICIDQQGDQEKNHQVAMMGDIYSKAEHVFACVGPHADDSEFMFNILKKRRSLFKDLYSALPPGTLSVHELMHPDILSKRYPRFRCMAIIDSKSRVRLYQAFISFVQRSYFSRVWIQQELSLAPKVSFCCEAVMASAESMLALNMLLYSWMYLKWTLTGSTKLLCKTLGHFPIFRRVRAVVPLKRDFLGTYNLQRCLALASTTVRGLALKDILLSMRDFQCADHRDKLYGVLSLVDFDQGPRLVPDYSKDGFEVAADTLYHTSRANRPLFRLWDFASLCCQLFEITMEAPSLCRALEVRSRPSGKASKSEDARLLQECWCYCERIGNRQGTSVSQTDNTPNLRLEHCQNFSKLWIGQETLVAYVPLDTRVGDWFTYSDYFIPQRVVLGVVVRTSNEGQYSIIGPTVSCYRGRLQNHMEFRGHWNVEDMLVLAWKSRHISPETASDDEISEFVNMRICGSPDSSYFTER